MGFARVISLTLHNAPRGVGPVIIFPVSQVRRRGTGKLRSIAMIAELGVAQPGFKPRQPGSRLWALTWGWDQEEMSEMLALGTEFREGPKSSVIGIHIIF